MPDPAPRIPVGWVVRTPAAKRGRPRIFIDVVEVLRLQAEMRLSLRKLARLLVVWDPRSRCWLPASPSTLSRCIKEFRASENEGEVPRASCEARESA